ncbi:methyl-accepting chemotaxis protein [Desulfocurvibacter africanus]|uniref:methyl-accepting chemotaxis protein n=1 Tax=Desulfocurvibacter africanus TaxID=873 RepID=UPI002FD922C6
MLRKRVTPVFIFSVTLAVVVAIATIVIYVTRSSHNMAISMEQQAMQQAGESVRQALKMYADNATGMIRTLSEQTAVHDALNGNANLAQDSLKTLLKDNPNVWSVIVFDDQGVIRAGINADMQDLTGQKRNDRDYFHAIMGGQDLFVGKTILTAKTGGGNMHIFLAVKAIRDAAGRVIGGVGIFPRWSDFTDSFIRDVRFGERGYGFMLDATGRFLFHVDKDLMLQDVSEHEFARKALELKKGSFFYEWQGESKYLTVTTDPATGWAVCMSAYTEELAETATNQRNILLGIGALAVLALVTIISLLVKRLVASPITDIEAFTRAVAGGDLKAILHDNFKYEFKSLSSNIQVMVAELKNKLGFAQGLLDGLTVPCIVTDQEEHILFVNQACLDLLEQPGKPSEFTGKTVGEFIHGEAGKKTVIGQAIREKRPVRNVQLEIVNRKGHKRYTQVDAAPMYDLDGKLIAGFALLLDLTHLREQQQIIEEQNKRIAQAAIEAERVSDQVASASEELSAQVEQSSQGAGVQQSRTGEAATAMEQMNSSVLEVARNASSVADLADRTKTMAKDGETVVASVVQVIGRINAKATELKGDMTKLGSQAQGIGQILGVISDIADQTNLLALNAAIEAARAGDAGRGFAVVADEVRKLAEKTMSATRDVENSIKSIQDSVQKSVANTDATTSAIQESTELAGRSGQALKSIVAMVEQTADQVRGIATASEEQSAASEQINRSIEEINRISSETSDAMNQSAQAVTDLARLAQELKGIIEQMQQ